MLSCPRERLLRGTRQSNKARIKPSIKYEKEYWFFRWVVGFEVRIDPSNVSIEGKSEGGVSYTSNDSTVRGSGEKGL